MVSRSTPAHVAREDSPGPAIRRGPWSSRSIPSTTVVRSPSARAVTQEAKQVLELWASFHRDEAGPEHQAFTALELVPDACRRSTTWSRTTAHPAVVGPAEPWLPVEIRSNVIPGRWAARAQARRAPAANVAAHPRRRSVVCPADVDRSGRLGGDVHAGRAAPRPRRGAASAPAASAGRRTYCPTRFRRRGARAESERSTCTCR